MRPLILTIIFFSWFGSTSQNQYSLDNIFDTKFKTDLDSISNICLVKCSEDIFDSATVNLKGSIVNINKYFKWNSTLGCRHRSKVKTYLYNINFSDSLAIFLNFYSNKLIEINVFYKGTDKNNVIKETITKHYKLQKYNNKAEDKLTKTYLAINNDGYNLLTISDKTAINYIPSNCGNSRQQRSWTKLDKYLIEKK
jgi:hypothetical protein